jgi:hypothetical protein
MGKEEGKQTGLHALFKHFKNSASYTALDQNSERAELTFCNKVHSTMRYLELCLHVTIPL